MSNKSKTIMLRLATKHTYIQCIRLVRFIGSIGLKDAKDFVDRLTEGEEVKLTVSRARLAEIRNEADTYGLLWRDLE